MEGSTHMYDVMWPKGKKAIMPTKAVIAARFEVCTDSLERFCLTLSPHFPESRSKSLSDCFGQLVSWGHQTGAKDQMLDYKLRKSHDMHEMVVELLTELQSNLQTGKQPRILDIRSLLTAVGLQILETDSVQVATRALEEKQDELFPAEIGPEQTDTDNTTNADPEVAVLLEDAGDITDTVEVIVENLVRLGPSLTRPYPQDIDVYSSGISNGSDHGDHTDVEIARQMFPRASRTLQLRLGHANWRRRLSHKATQEHLRLSGRVFRKRNPKEPKRTGRQEIAQDAFNFQKPTLRDMTKVPNLTPFLPLMSVNSSSRAPSDIDESSIAPSVWDTGPERPKLDRVMSATTMSSKITSSTNWKKPAQQQPAPTQRPSLVVSFPKVPVELDDVVAGQPQLFTCNLCGYDLEAGGKIKTEDDWKRHVFEDLEAYLCTFDECFSAQEMYAVRDEWYKHELETHRIKKVWVCAACSREFGTKKQAEVHVEEHTSEFDEDDIFMMKAMLRQTLSSKTLDNQNCPLCQTKVKAGETKDHISMHLEEFALMSIIGEESSEEDESDDIFSQTNDDAMSERGIKEAVLNHFVTEQLKLNLERGKQPPDKYMEPGSGIDLLDDMSDYDGSKDSESRVGGKGDESRNLLIQRMLEGQRGELDTSPNPVNSRRSPRPPPGLAGPPSLASSTEKMPLLRTWSFPRNDDFMGRDKDLASLYKILSEPGRVCVVSAEGGMGKTALAVEYSWRYEHCYHYIFWVQAETPVGSSDTFCQIALQLRLAPEGTEQDVLIKLGRDFLETTQDKRWLLVFDNVEKWDDIDVYTPSKTSTTNGSILITTRHESLTAPSRPINYFRITLQELDVDEGRKLLIHRLPPELRPQENSLRDPEYKIAGEIAGLAGLPLLITYISGYVRQSGCSLAEFWEYWDEWRPKARMGNGSAESQDRSASVFHLALRDLSPDARKVLEIMAFLDSDGIQKELLMRNDPNKPGPAYLKPARFRVIIPNLLGQGFVEQKNKRGDREIYSVHRILQARLLKDLNGKPQKRDEIFRHAFDLVRFHLPRPSLDTPEPAKWNVFKEYLPHVLSLQKAYGDPLSITTPTPFLGLAELFKDGGVLLWQRYIHVDALRLLNSAEKILDELEIDEENLRAEINITINLLLQYSGISKRKESKERLARILEYRKRIVKKKAPQEVTRDDEILLNNAFADYANALLQFNDYRNAEPIYQTCYAKYRELGTDTDPTDAFAIAKLHHHMAYCRMYRQDFKRAIELSEKAVGIIEQLGDRQITLRYQYDLACIILQSGDKERALALHREILEARLEFQGRANYFSLQSQYAYAAMCHYVGRFNEAERWMRRALSKASERGGKNFWPDAAVARTKYHLSQVLREMAPGQPNNEADELAREAKDVLSKMLPYDPEPIVGVKEEDTGALFDHLQPVFGGRFTGLSLLKYVS